MLAGELVGPPRNFDRLAGDNQTESQSRGATFNRAWEGPDCNQVRHGGAGGTRLLIIGDEGLTVPVPIYMYTNP